jgi:hypothetical protein
MPDNPNVPAVLSRVKAAADAQARLRAAMAQVAAEVAVTPPRPAGKPAGS